MASARRRWMALYALATFWAFPQHLSGFTLDLGLLLAPLPPVFLVLAVRGLEPRRALRTGFVAAWLGYSAVLFWIYVVTVTYGEAPAPVGVVAPMGLAVYLALFSALFAAGVAFFRGRGLTDPFLLAAWWTATDHLRAFVFSGFPWATLGYAWHLDRPLVALTEFSGIYGLCFAAALTGLAGLALVEARRTRSRWPRSALAALGLVVAAHGLGAARLAADGPQPSDTLRVAVLQGNIDQGVKWSPEWAGTILSIYEELTRKAARQGADVVLWPETAAPGSIATDAELAARLRALARESGVDLVVGGVGVALEGERVLFFDSAFLFDRAGQLTDRYDKAHLVPFGEYVPLRGLLGRFLGAVARGIAPMDVWPGDGPRPVRVAGPGGEGSVTAGVVICYELLFPDLVRRFVDGGAELLFAITNDAWYGRTGAPYQFLAITALRSAENRVWTARAANTGVSGFIDDRGRVVEQTDIFERDLRVADVPLRPAPVGGSFYSRHGNVFAGACWLAVVAAALAARSRGRRTQESDVE